MKGIVLHRDLVPGIYPLRQLVEGLDESPALCDLFGGPEGCAAALDMARVEIVDAWGYMWVDDEEGMLHVSLPYWREGPEMHLYLDLVHELVHVKQFGEGRDLFDHNHKYVARPTEIEAYQVTVAEARRLGMPDPDLTEFLYVEWISHDDHVELCNALGVPPPGHLSGPPR